MTVWVRVHIVPVEARSVAAGRVAAYMADSIYPDIHPDSLPYKRNVTC